MTIMPLAEAEQRINTIRAALTAYRDELTHLADRAAESRVYSIESAYRVALIRLAPVFAALDGRDVADAEPVEPRLLNDAERRSLRVGDRVTVRDDNGNVADYTVKYAPWQLGHGQWVIGLTGIAGGYLLSRVVAKFDGAETLPAIDPRD